jgi:hypothetical protein
MANTPSSEFPWQNDAPVRNDDDEIDDFQPKELAAPTLPTPSREDFLDTRIRFLRRVREETGIGHGGLTSKYQYSRLKEKEVRFIDIEPGEGNGEIKCDMKYGTLDDKRVAQKYYALSYHWGTDYPTNRITIRDSRRTFMLPTRNKFASLVSQKMVSQMPAASKSGPAECWFLVTDNLISALRTLRDKDTKVRLWVDAICIDQDPTNDRSRKEKEQQVGNMAQIYNSAYGVCIWLGDSSPTTDLAMKFIKDIVTEMPRLEVLLKERPHGCQALMQLMTFKWFSRSTNPRCTNCM